MFNLKGIATGFILGSALIFALAGTEASAAPQKPTLFIEKVTTPAGVEKAVEDVAWGDYLYMGATSVDRLERPMFEIRCTQNGKVVYGTALKDIASDWQVYGTPYSELRSTLWASGAADCVARLIDLYGGGKFPYRNQDTLEFTVAP